MKTMSQMIMKDQEDEIIEAIEKFRLDCNAEYSDCYIGLTKNPQERINETFIVEGHTSDGRHEQKDPVLVKDTGGNDAASRIEDHFHGLGMQGGNGPGKGVKTSKFIYCFIDRTKASDAVIKIIDNEKTREKIITKGNYKIK